MASAESTEYEAFVVWWDSGTIAVLCPLCGEFEDHDTQLYRGTFKLDESLTLTALCCSSGVPYRAMFPWMVELGWEKNWDEKRFDTVGLDVSELDCGKSSQPTSLAAVKPYFRAGQCSQSQGNRTTRGLAANPLSLCQGLQPREGENRGQGQNPGFNQVLRKSVPPFSQRTTLGDMRLLQSKRPKSNRVEILAPAATIDSIQLSGPLAVINSSRTLEHKTVAVLDRKGPYPPIIAVSGWKDSLSSRDNVIDQDLWSQQVHILSEYVSHKPDVNNMDKGLEGRVCGSHAEKQLMVYFIRMHCFLEDGFEDYEMDLLNTFPSHQGLREAWIAIDNKPCRDCHMFKKKLEAVCNVKFHFVRMKDDFRLKKDIKVRGPKTPARPSTRKMLLLTPPDSGSSLNGKIPQQPEEEGTDEEYQGTDIESPSYQRNLRSVAGRFSLTASSDTSSITGPAPAVRYRKFGKRLRSESLDNSDEGLGNILRSSRAKRNSLSRKRSGYFRHSMGSALDSEPQPLPILARSKKSELLITNLQPLSQRQLRRMPTASMIKSAIDEVADADEEQEQDAKQVKIQEQKDAQERDRQQEPAEPNHVRENFPSQGAVIIDLTGDDDDCWSAGEGSNYSP